MHNGYKYHQLNDSLPNLTGIITDTLYYHTFTHLSNTRIVRQLIDLDTLAAHIFSLMKLKVLR